MKVIIFALVAAIVAADHPVAHYAARAPVTYNHHHTYLYHGHYPGRCHADGLYYRDARSYVTCANGLAYVMPCAPGTANSGRYRPGHKYATQTFCDVNLNDLGYAAHHNQHYAPAHPARPYQHHGPHYLGPHYRPYYGYNRH